MKPAFESEEVATWDMHATATPGDWMELQNTLEVFPGTTRFTARKGTFGHGMSVCGGWELTAQHLGFSKGNLLPINLGKVRRSTTRSNPTTNCLVANRAEVMKGDVAGQNQHGGWWHQRLRDLPALVSHVWSVSPDVSAGAVRGGSLTGND